MRKRLLSMIILCLAIVEIPAIVGFHVGYLIPQHQFDNAYDDAYSFGMEIRKWGEEGYGSEINIDYIYSESSSSGNNALGDMDYYYRLIPLTTTFLVREGGVWSYVYMGVGTGYYFHWEHAEWKGETTDGSSTQTSASYGLHFLLGFQSSVFQVQVKYFATSMTPNENVHYWNDSDYVDIAAWQMTFGLNF